MASQRSPGFGSVVVSSIRGHGRFARRRRRFSLAMRVLLGPFVRTSDERESSSEDLTPDVAKAAFGVGVFLGERLQLCDECLLDDGAGRLPLADGRPEGVCADVGVAGIVWERG